MASTLLNDPHDRKGPYARKNEEYLKSFLQILTRLEKMSSIHRPSPPAVDDARGLFHIRIKPVEECYLA